MPSFDIVNKVDLQEVDNAVNNALKQIRNRYDFRDSDTSIELNRKDAQITLHTENEMRLHAVQEVLAGCLSKRSLDVKSLQYGAPEPTAKGHVKVLIKIIQGIEKDDARALVKKIKVLKLKVQAAIQDDQVRVTGKKIDDLQQVMKALRNEELKHPVQFVNMK